MRSELVFRMAPLAAQLGRYAWSKGSEGSDEVGQFMASTEKKTLLPLPRPFSGL